MNTAVLNIVVVSCILMSWSLPHHHELRFSRTFYNVTIPENSVSRTLVTSSDRMGVHRRSADDDVTYRIVTGDPDRIFKVEDKAVGDFTFLVLRTRSGNSVVLNRERKDKFVLTVKAFSTRTTVEATTIIYVRVLDQNDLSPIFFQSAYNETLPEDFSLHRPVLKVTAEDADLGVNGDVLYWLQEPTEYFTIHPFLGVVTLTKRLKYSERSIHDLAIVAQDRATIFRGGGQASVAGVSVTVKQVNLYGPEIYVYVLQDPTAHKLGLVYAVVRVVDRDEGVHGQISEVQIVNGDSEGLFIIDPIDDAKSNSRTEYNIILTNAINLYSTALVHNLSLQVTDRGFPPRKSFKAVSISVNSESDDEPSLFTDSYEINVPEYIPQGFPLLRPDRLNIDQFLSNQFEFKITEGNLGDVFHIDDKTLMLHTIVSLDSEQKRTFSLSMSILRKITGGMREVSSSKVKVNVIDSNDNDPVFNEIPDEVWVTENQPAGTHVVKLSATDLDSGDNGYLTYSIANIKPTPFEVDPLSGVLRTTQPLDYESMRRSYIVRVRASDSGFPFRRETEKLLRIKTKNINDNSPMFSKGECSLSVPKNLKIGTDLFSITATDTDETDVITYSVSSSYNESCIQIDVSKALLSLQCDLSYISRTEWELNVTASDGLYKAVTSIRVFVASSEVDPSQMNLVQYSCRDVQASQSRDEFKKIFTLNEFSPGTVDNIEFETMLTSESGNLNDPQIFGLAKSITVNESVQQYSKIICITAFDKDGGFNGELVYGMTCEPEYFVFSIDPDQGCITVIGMINFETQSEFILNISVCDQGTPQRCSSESLEIKINKSETVKINFKDSYQKLYISENTKVGSELLRVGATNEGYHSQNITYHLVSSSDHFIVDSKSGPIVLKAALDRETTERHVINVRASYGDSVARDSLHSDITVTFYVVDVNDNAPTFVNTRLEVNVREDLPQGSVLFVVNTIDLDQYAGEQIVYSVLDTDHFTVDSSTGTIRLRGRLDYETKSEHRVTVQASDKGTPSLSSRTTFIINVIDVNENLFPPVFDEVVVVMSVRENLPVGTLVGTVTASDADPPGVDSKITYSIHEGEGQEYFSISEQGHLHTAAILDAESAAHFWLTVVAADGGMVPLSASVQVYISVVDDNDHLPLTLESAYQFDVEENLPPHTPVAQVSAADKDLDSANLSYSIAHSSSRLPFTIDSNTGLISTATLLDREEHQEYILQVVVTDQGLSSTTQVLVTVVDVNDHTPQYHQDHYNVHLALQPQAMPQKLIVQEMEQIFPDGEKWTTSSLLVSDNIVPVFQVLAVDADMAGNGTVFYSVASETPFLVNEDTGQMYARSSLVPGSQYDVLVRASDHGRPSRSAITKVTLHTPRQAHAPKRLASVEHLIVEARESMEPGQVITKLNSSLGDTSQLTFMITGGNGMGHLAMRGDSLLVARRLDCEARDILGLTLRAANSTAQWDIKISVRVLDVNEYGPRFEHSLYSLNVSEGTPVDSILATLEASDMDLTSTLSYAIHNHHPGSDMFTMDPLTGDLILTGPLDREVSSVHQLTVVVSDGGDAPRQGYARVSVLVWDVNDHRPEWPRHTLSLTVLEDTPEGRQVAHFVATDRDTGDNGQVTYSIISGNTNSTFKVHPELGSLTLVKAVDSLQTPDFQLTVRAQDRGSPRLESSITVHVIVLPSEKKPPVCVDRDPWTEVSEKTALGEVVGHVTVEGPPSLTYELVAGDPQGHFAVNPSSGDVLLQRPLDYETTNQHNLTFAVTSLAGMRTLCSMRIYVIDFNDNPPIFKKDYYSGYVWESAELGSVIMTEHGPLRVLAVDLDSGVNGLVQFTVQNCKDDVSSTDPTAGYIWEYFDKKSTTMEDEPTSRISDKGHDPHPRGDTAAASTKVHDCGAQDFVSIDPITGTVRTARVLDFEQFTDIHVLVSVSDLGHPALTSDSVASLHVKVRDVNDCPPMFTQEAYNATVLMPTDKDVLVFQVIARDPDSSAVTSLRYSIISGNEDLSLTMDAASGAIYVYEPLRVRPRRLTVQAHDGLHQALTVVDIQVLQKEQSTLRFQKPLYHAAVLENSTKASVVAVVSVLGSRLNENIRFSILNRSPMFKIGITSGVISTDGQVFDRERLDFYRLIVQAYSTDRQLTAHSAVNVSVLDANDNCPQFINLPYRATVTGNATKGDFVFKVIAKDSDTGDNGEVRYEMDQSGSEMFRIGRKSGEIRLKNLAVLNRQDTTVVITANDGGIVPCSTTTSLKMSVIDWRAPLWERTVYKAQVAESAALFSVVAVSLKATAVNKVVYQLVKADNFLLRHDTGVLQVFDPLDRETSSHEALTVRATDAVTGLSSDTLVILEITDVNDCPPQFLQDSYQVRVLESAQVGSNLTKVTASDLDQGMNAAIHYAISDPQFRVDPTDGTLMLQERLDYERIKLHHVTVIATDAGVPPLSSFVTVLVEVLNTNDNAPVVIPPPSGYVVSQDAPRGGFVGKVAAQDADGDILSYRMTSPSELATRAFSVAKDTGIITVLNPRTFEKFQDFSFNISVDDGLHSTTAVLDVKVLISNRHSPQFDRSLYEVLLLENQPAGRLLIRVTAADKDRGIFGNITYTLPIQRSSKYFAINKVTGDISTLQPLDRELVTSHFLHVKAQDGGGLVGWTTVHVKVLDENDNKPSFELPQYFGCVQTNITTSQEILKVMAVDGDESSARQVQYSITAVEPRQARHWFTIHPQEGSLSALASLHNHEPQLIKLTVRASDGGNPPLHSDVTVTLVLLSRDHPLPPLRHLPSRIVVPPNSTLGNVIHQFKLTAPVKVEFRVVGGEDSFSVNSSGHLLLSGPPSSREKKIGLLVQASRKPFASCAFKQITIENAVYKTKAPVFVEENVELNFPENIAVGSFICKVSTEEDDRSVLFSIAAITNLFSVDPLTGWVSVTAPLDRESRGGHQVKVVATDSSSPSLSSSCLIHITLSDCNDNPHIFNQEIYNVAVKEDAPVGSVLTRLSLADPDEDHGPLTFYISEGDSATSFSMTGELELVLSRPLDRESTPSYFLTVLASDGLFSTTATVNVLVIDVNDERHRCLHTMYGVMVSESWSPEHLVTSILTSDPDLESSLEYRLSGAGWERFSIDNHGEVRLRQYLDRETTAGYLLDATVADSTHPSWTCTSRIRVTVEDVNDNPPSFAVTNETITLTEDAAVGMIVTKIQLLDFDEGENRQVVLSLVNPTGLFRLSSHSGLLTLSRPLQSSPGSVHSVTVKATDLGTPALSSFSTLQVIVLGMNDDPPVHVSRAFHVSVSEDAPAATRVLHVQGFGEEVLGRGNVIYTILEGNVHGEFDIDKRTGVLSTVKPLDYEARQDYQLLLLATSVGDSPLASYTAVNVTVLDVNDNPPVFKVNRYSVQIRESVEVGQMVLKVEADDIDSGRNGIVQFVLDDESIKTFAVDSFTGVLTVASPLDREKTDHYTILVQAVDQGSPSLSSTATVNIDVTDENDNPPVFLQPNATAILQLTSGNEREMFRVDPDGTLRTTDKLSIQLGDLFTLTVRVEDGGNPSLHSSTWIYIKVVEPSKHPPVVLPLRVWVGAYEQQWQGGDLGHVIATDLDPYDKLEYSTTASPQFTVEPRQGMLKARSSLAPGMYSVNVSVTDGKFSTSSLVSVTVHPLSQDMLQTSVYIRLSKRTKPESLVAKLPLFLSTLKSAFLRDVTLISVQHILNSTLGLLVAVAGGADLNVVQEVMSSTGLQGTTPQCDCRNGGVCQRQLQMMPERTNVFSAAGLSFVTPGHSLAYYCICSIGYAGEHCEQVKCLCPPLQVCVPQRVGFACMPPCSATHTCPAAMTSKVTWSEALIYLLLTVAVLVAIVAFIVYRRYKSTANGERKYGSWGKHNCYIKKKTKLSNLEASQKPPIFTGSPNNGTISRNNLEATPGIVLEGEVIPLDYLRNINPLTAKMENDILQGHSSAPDLATCHATDSFITDDPARDLAALDDQLCQDVVQYGFPPPGVTSPLTEEMEVPL